jgi:hypothetical protein
MRKARFLLLLLFPALPAFAQQTRPHWPASVTITENRLDVFWERCPEGSQEWEAFLSLDGGRSFPIRVTPHLSTKIRSFSWPIPRILSEDTKLRIRFGNGQTEREYDLDGNWRLFPTSHARPLLSQSRDIGRSPARGEEATALWVEWNGAAPRTVMPIAPPSTRSSSAWRCAEIAGSALPSRRLALAPPTASAERSAPSVILPAARLVALLRPSLAAFSRLNL